DGLHPEYAELYGARELPGARGAEGLRARTDANVRDADAVLIFGNIHSAGSKCTLAACRCHGKPWMHVAEGVRPSDVARWLDESGVRVLMVAGNRESSCRGIGVRVEAFMRRMFARLRHGEP